MNANAEDFYPNFPSFDFQMTELSFCHSKEFEVDKNAKMKNRMAAKKFREKKNEFLNKLEIENDHLLRETLRLLRMASALKAENKILEENIEFFQSLLYRIMKKK